MNPEMTPVSYEGKGGDRRTFCGSEAEFRLNQRMSLAEHAQSALVGERDICV